MATNGNITECVPFLLVRDVGATIEWYERIGFECTATNHVWDPDDNLNWARIEWDGAAFMIGPDERGILSTFKDSSLWFNVGSVHEIVDLLIKESISFDKEEETFYGRKVISFKDINGFTVAFSSVVTRT